MKEITIDDLIIRNTDYLKQPYTLSLVQPEKGLKFDDWSDSNGKLQVVIPNVKGAKIYFGRDKLCDFLSKKTCFSKKEIENIIENEGCVAINNMNLRYKCCYLLFDYWFVIKSQ